MCVIGYRVGHEEDSDDDDTQERQDDHEADEQPTTKRAQHSDSLEEVHYKKPDAGYMSEQVEDTDDDPNSDDNHQYPTTEHNDALEEAHTKIADARDLVEQEERIEEYNSGTNFEPVMTDNFEGEEPVMTDNFEGEAQARITSTAKQNTAAIPKQRWYYCKHCKKRYISEYALHYHVVMKHNGQID